MNRLWVGLGAGLLCVLAAFGCGWMAKGVQVAHANEAAAVAVIEQVKVKTETANAAVAETAKEYRNEKTRINSGILPADYSLRIKQCGHLSGDAGTPTGTDATAENGTDPKRTGEVDFTNVAREIESIGTDLEEANLQIEYLQKLVLDYKNSCK